MADDHRLSAPGKLFLKSILNVLVVWGMAVYLHEYVTISGAWKAFIIIGALLTLMNIIVRPVLSLIALPLKLFAMLIALIIVNGGFAFLILRMTQMMDSRLVVFTIHGILGWIVVSITFGLTNWIMRVSLK